MTYATQQDLVDRFGDEQLAQLSDRYAGAVIDADVVSRALTDADAEIDGYLAALYALPLAAVPDILVRMACDIARYRLFGDRVTEQVRQLYTDAVRDLKAISSGAIKIDGAAALSPSSASDTIQVKSPERLFGVRQHWQLLMDLSPIIDRLKTQLIGFKSIGGAADLDAIGTGVVPTPSCYVIPMRESARDIDQVGAFEQAIAVGFAVVLVHANRRDASGAGVVAELDPLRRQIKTALNGWPVEAQFGEPARFTSGSLLRFDDGLLWWADEFSVITYERKV